MASLNDTFVPSSTYNTLPTISQVADAPESHAQDLQDLRDLLSKYNVPKDVSIRLIHKHFDTTEGEVMIFDNIPVEGHGCVQIMKPIVPSDSTTIRGIHYLVNDKGSLQAYEYGNFEVVDMSGFQPFLVDFCRLVSERGLQHIFGLKLRREDGTSTTGWTEYEFHAMRGTTMFPDGMPMPDGESDFTVSTEWKPIFNELPSRCKHQKNCKHCRHCTQHESAGEAPSGLICLGGQTLMPGSPIHEIVHQLVAAF